MRSKDMKCEHALAINTMWRGSDQYGDLDRMTCYCTKCGKSFDCIEIRTGDTWREEINEE